MEEEKKDIYTLIYIQKQEQLLLDMMRKIVDAEVRITAMNNSINEANARFEESQKQVELSNEMMQQAAAGLEEIQLDNQNLRLEVGNLHTEISALQDNYTALDKKNQALIYEKENAQGQVNLKLVEADNKIKELEKTVENVRSSYDLLNDEYKRAVEEVNNLTKQLESSDTKKARKGNIAE